MCVLCPVQAKKWSSSVLVSMFWSGPSRGTTHAYSPTVRQVGQVKSKTFAFAPNLLEFVTVTATVTNGLNCCYIQHNIQIWTSVIVRSLQVVLVQAEHTLTAKVAFIF